MEAVHKKQEHRGSGKFGRRFLQYLVLSVFLLIILVPIVLIVFGSLKTRGEFASTPYTFPNPPRWENYERILTQPSTFVMLRNSIVVMVVSVAGTLVVSSLAAFVFARMRFRGQTMLMNIALVGLMFPMNVAILPIYLIIKEMQLTDNLWGIMLPQIAFGLAVNILILRGFFMSVPTELQDAAYIDGCSTFGFFWRILLPLARPAMSAVAVLAMLGSWNSYFLPLTILNSEKWYTLPLGTMQFVGQYGSEQNMVMAFLFLSMVPALIFYVFAERQIVSGLTAGALKG
ncbi:MAG: carbohydrate ABC transporter permease [Anaerolineae bacterium]|nr:carbohydrate ABC transporter permease [Anaerolineae bacterium]